MNITSVNRFLGSWSRLLTLFVFVLCGLFLLNLWNNNKQSREGTTKEETVKQSPPPEVPPTEDLQKFSADERGFWKGLGAVKGHVFDEYLAKALVEFFKKENVQTVLELGAGTGSYAKLLKAEGFKITCYDGNPNTQELSEGRCGIIDLSKPIDFFPRDWVLSLEVGEHIPNKFEKQFLTNLHNGNKKGIVLSWAIEGQGGMAHVNNHNNDYLRAKFSELGYSSDFEAEKILKGEAVYWWFKNTTMVFRKQ